MITKENKKTLEKLKLKADNKGKMPTTKEIYNLLKAQGIKCELNYFGWLEIAGVGILKPKQTYYSFNTQMYSSKILDVLNTDR